MADPNTGFDFNQLAQRMGMGQQKSGEEMPGNEDFIDTLKSSAENIAGAAFKFFGLNLREAGKTSITQPIDREGVVNQNIPSLVTNLNANGGVIARIVSVLTKNNVITDHTQGAGGGSLEANLGNLTPTFASADLPPLPVASRDTGNAAGAAIELG